MNAARRFLGAVIPWEVGGYCTIHWHRPKTETRPKSNFFGQSCSTIDEALGAVGKALKLDQFDIYFCTTRQRLNSGERTAAGALACMSVFMDADIGEDGYATAGQAMAAILMFCDEVKIPRPSIMVCSGGGIHAYWLSHRPLLIPDWLAYANALKAAAKRAGLKLDFRVMADAARVLRVPDTFNWKTGKPRPVFIIEEYSTWERHRFTEVFEHLLDAPEEPEDDAFDFGPIPEEFADLHPHNLGEGIDEFDVPPLHLEPILEECPWLKHVHDTGGADQKEPLWFAMVRCCTFLEDGHELAHKLGKDHPKYSYKETEEKWARAERTRQDKNKNYGWPRCHTIHEEGSTQCKGCPRLKLDKSPVNAAYEAACEAEEEAREEEAKAEQKAGPDINGASVADDLGLPSGFQSSNGIICYEDSKRKKKPKLIPILKTELSEPKLCSNLKEFGMSFTATTDFKDGHQRTQRVTFMLSDFTSQQVVSIMAKQSVIIEYGKEKKVRELGPAWVDKWRRQQEAAEYEGKLGWRIEKGEVTGFAYHTGFYKLDGTVQSLSSGYTDEVRRWYQPTGKREAWLAAANLLLDRKRPELAVLISTGFAGPLLQFGGVYGGTLSVYGDPGTGKTAGQRTAAALYGQPKQTRESLNSTAKSVNHRLGIIRNLPVFWDDIQDEQKQEKLFEALFTSAEGAQHGRLAVNQSYQERLEWGTLMVVCSNASFVEFVLKKQKSTTAGLRRVLEVHFSKKGAEPGMTNPYEANKIFAALDHNYGVVGEEYIQLITKKFTQVKKLLDITIEKFRASVSGTPDENYWWTICGALITGAMLAHHLGVKINYEAMEFFLREQFLKNRELRTNEGTEGGSYGNTEIAISDFLKFYIGSRHAVYTDVTYKNGTNDVNILHSPLEGRPVYVHVVRDERKILISQKMLREHLQKQNIQVRQVVEGLQEFFFAKKIRSLTLAAGTSYGTAQERVIEIPVPPGMQLLEDILNAYAKPST